MALNKLKTGIAFSAQIPEQNANLDEIENRLNRVDSKLVIMHQGEISGHILTIIDGFTNKNAIYVLELSTNITGLPSGTGFQYGKAFVTFRSGYPLVLLQGYDGQLATIAKVAAGWRDDWTLFTGTPVART